MKNAAARDRRGRGGSEAAPSSSRPSSTTSARAYERRRADAAGRGRSGAAGGAPRRRRRRPPAAVESSGARVDDLELGDGHTAEASTPPPTKTSPTRGGGAARARAASGEELSRSREPRWPPRRRARDSWRTRTAPRGGGRSTPICGRRRGRGEGADALVPAAARRAAEAARSPRGAKRRGGRTRRRARLFVVERGEDGGGLVVTRVRQVMPMAPCGARGGGAVGGSGPHLRRFFFFSAAAPLDGRPPNPRRPLRARAQTQALSREQVTHRGRGLVATSARLAADGSCATLRLSSRAWRARRTTRAWRPSSAARLRGSCPRLEAR